MIGVVELGDTQHATSLVSVCLLEELVLLELSKVHDGIEDTGV
jgi:hypothetical protein